MNLNQIREQIKNITDYSPDLQAYANQLDSLINNAYFNIWRNKRWNFAEKQTFLEAYPDITSERETGGVGPAITAFFTDGQRLVTFSAPVNTLWNKKDIYEGNIIELNSREYTIVQILAPTQLSVAEPIRITGGVITNTIDNWRVKARFYTLPEDCIELLSVAHRDIPVGNQGNGQILPPYGKLYGILPRHDEELGLREDYTQTYAEAYIPIPPAVVPPAETWDHSFVEDPNGEWNTFGGQYLELCWSFMNPTGQVGPLSEEKIIQVPLQPGTNALQVNFKTFDNQPVQSLNGAYGSGPGTKRNLEGLRKVLWYNANFDRVTGTRLGLPQWRQVILGAAAAGLNTANQDDPVIAADIVANAKIYYPATALGPGTKLYREYDGQHLRIRPYPRIDAFDFEYIQAATDATTPPRLRDFFRRLEMRYYYKPAPLVLKTDTPELPYEFHSLIVYGALEDIYNKSGNSTLAEQYRRKQEKLLRQFEKRYVDRTDLSYQKGQFGVPRDRFIYDQQSLRNKSL